MIESRKLPSHLTLSHLFHLILNNFINLFINLTTVGLIIYSFLIGCVELVNVFLKYDWLSGDRNQRQGPLEDGERLTGYLCIKYCTR